MARTPENRCVPVSEWPEPDRAAWLRGQQPLDLLDATVGQANRWAPDTQKMIESSYGRWLGWLQLTGQLRDHETPGERAQPDRLRAYLEALKAANLADYTCARLIQQLGDALKVMAPDEDFAWVSRAGGRLHSSAKPSKDLRPRLRMADEVLQLGLDMMHAAKNDRFRTSLDRACLFRDGLLIALLTLRPIRSKNLTALTLDRHVVKRGDTWWLSLPPEEGKTGKELECLWPEQLASQLERYLDVHRPALLQCSTRGDQAGHALWVSKQGTPMTSDALSFQVKARTAEEFGEPINLHSFRHIAATTIATVDPDNTAHTAAILGHTDLEASDKHYNRGRTVAAGKRYHATLADVRRGL
jgi:site-specific recombinase XerD